ncbi:MAG: type VI secretion system tip protein TssI/VgrG [Polyangiaceae bacterium]
MSTNEEVRIASGDALDVREFSVSQSMSTLFSVTVTAVSTNPNIDFEAAIGLEASFTLHGRGLGGVPQTWRGVLSELHQVRVDQAGVSTYQLRIEPKLWLASQRRNNRIYQGKSELDIARSILREWGVESAERITHEYKTRKYRVQYGETDFGFFSRMLEEAGISFHFVDHGGHTLCVLTDAPQENAERPLPIAFRDEPGAANVEYVTAVRVSRQVRPGKVTLRDHDYRRPSAYALGASASERGVEENLESFHYEPGAFLVEATRGDFTPAADDKGMHRTDEMEGQELAARRLAATRGDASTIHFETNVIDLAPGTVLRFLDHPQREVGEDKKLLVVASNITGTFDTLPKHRCEARSAAAAYHPPLRQPKPKAGGVESATVVGPPGEEIHTDEFGRVRVQFHWDREGTRDDNSSCWIHVSQSWSGAGYGATNLPRVGQEVIVDFLGGDPDRPVVTGRVYTNLQKTPYPLPENKTRSGWRSNSSPSYGGYNEIMFEDKAGGELFHTRAQRNMTTQVNNDHLSSVGNNKSTSIGKNESKSVGGNHDCTVQGSNSESTGADFMQAVMGMFTSLASSDRVLTTNGSSSSSAQTHVISSDQGTTLTVGNSVIHIGPDSIIIQTPKLLLNPGESTAASAALGGPTTKSVS